MCKHVSVISLVIYYFFNWLKSYKDINFFPFDLRVKAVTDGILKLITDQKNGSILKVSANGTDYVPE